MEKSEGYESLESVIFIESQTSNQRLFSKVPKIELSQDQNLRRAITDLYVTF